MTQEQIINAGIDYTMSTRPVCMGGAAFEEQIKQYNRNHHLKQVLNGLRRILLKRLVNFLQE